MRRKSDASTALRDSGTGKSAEVPELELFARAPARHRVSVATAECLAGKIKNAGHWPGVSEHVLCAYELPVTVRSLPGRKW